MTTPRPGIGSPLSSRNIEAMADLLAPGAWWLHHTRGSNVFLVEATDGRLALIDTGFGTNVQPILDEVASVAPGRSLSHILLTHSHADHAGAAAELSQRTGARVAIGRADCLERDGRLVVRRSVGRSHLARLVVRRLLRWHGSLTEVHEPLSGELEVLPGILAVPVPGHTPGSYCFIQKASALAFVGDLVISHRGRMTRPLRYANVDDQQYLDTLASFAAIAPRGGCPGHGPPALEGFPQQLAQLSRLGRGPGSSRPPHVRLARMRSFASGMYRRRRPGADLPPPTPRE